MSRPSVFDLCHGLHGSPESCEWRALNILAVLLATLWSGVVTGAQPELKPDQRVILITGSTDGLGREVALRLGAGGAHVIVHGRNRERGEAVVRQIETEGNGSARLYVADLSSLAEVRSFATKILEDYRRLDVLINNAGIWLERTPERRLSVDGYELHFAVNYLAGYALTRLLLPRIVSSAPSRIINIASGAQTPIDFNDPMLEHGYTPLRAYAQSKLAQILFTMDLAEELTGTGVTVVALHPAARMDTTMVRESGLAPRSTVDEGARAVLQLVMSPNIRSGDYYSRLQPARANEQAYDADARAKLRALSGDLTGAQGPAVPLDNKL